ncbi:Aste57867_2288 [Aphanomyces stellatus]|uniref:Aste57867_2288 protein n=1 Tax=Aphanomyces stellatus TaxID=120398 RepID=A0A485K8B4_9STRA|nr:hypothetical protein As57867_002283 [Aphanomyces stellatus]VFT79491.1 Aste57867_2288 [Aphanomyces stellatus]
MKYRFQEDLESFLARLVLLHMMNLSKSNWVDPNAVADAPAPPMSLRYLNEFVGKLQCAPQLLKQQIFPDAKEVTESMGLFNAARRFLSMDDADEATDGIVVVGDGSTPRTAVMFAHRTKGWTCYSIDPEMRLSTDSEQVPWEGIQKVVPIRAKIEDIEIHLRRAIVVLVHAHVTLEQALSAIQCKTVVGVLTVPCCNWYGQQEQLFGRHPDVVYDDFSILSDHREIRAWLGDGSRASVSLNQSTKALTGCVLKSYVNPQQSIDAKTAALDRLHDDTLVKMVAGAAPTAAHWPSLLSLLQLPSAAKVGLLGDATGAFRALAGFGQPFSTDATFDVVLDLGMLHECLYAIESRLASPLILQLCRTIRACLEPTTGRFVCLTPRRKLKGTSFFANPALQWILESKALGESFVMTCKPMQIVASDTDDPSFEVVQADLRRTSSAFDARAAATVIQGTITSVRIKSRKLTFLDVHLATGQDTQVVLNFQRLEQGNVANPQQVARHLRVGDTVCAKGELETPTKLNALVLDILARRPEPTKPRYGIEQ